MPRSEICWCHSYKTMQIQSVRHWRFTGGSYLKYAVHTNVGHTSGTVCCSLIVPERDLCLHSNFKKGWDIHMDQDSPLSPSCGTSVSSTRRTLATATRRNRPYGALPYIWQPLWCCSLLTVFTLFWSPHLASEILEFEIIIVLSIFCIYDMIYKIICQTIRKNSESQAARSLSQDPLSTHFCMRYWNTRRQDLRLRLGRMSRAFLNLYYRSWGACL